MFKLPILERYIGYEILRIFLVILVVLSLILLGGSLVKVLKLAASGVIPADSVFTLIFLELLRLGGRLIPAAFFFATVMTLGRLYQDQEMTVLQSSGLGLGKVRRMVILVAVPMALISAWLMLAGIILFSGSLYLLTLSGVRWLGVITPFGGICFLLAWLNLAISHMPTRHQS